MADSEKSILDDIASYYAEKLIQNGQTPQGVDWNNAAGQILRFDQLLKLLPGTSRFSINDLGCGYGALLNLLQSTYSDFDYLGIDASNTMVSAAIQRHLGNRRARFLCAAEPDAVADYGVASGIFNVRLTHDDQSWRTHLNLTLDILNRTSRLGFGFNCLTSYSDKDRMRPDLYYADPCEIFDHCKRNFSKQVALLHDYGLYEFTILIRKES